MGNLGVIRGTEAEQTTRKFKVYDLKESPERVKAEVDDFAASASSDRWLDEDSDNAEFERYEQRRYRHQEQMNSLVELFRLYQLRFKKMMQPDVSEQEKELARKTLETIFHVLNLCGCPYMATSVNEEGFRLVLIAYTGSIDNQDDARFVRSFMIDDKYNMSIRMTFFYKLLEGKSSIEDMRRLAAR